MRHALILFSKASVSALVASAVDFIVSAALAHGLGVYYVHATWIGAVTGGVLNCIINYRWVFHAEGSSKIAVALKYLLVWLASIGLNTLGTWLLTETVCSEFLVGKVLTSVLVAVFWNYPLQRFFVYRQPETKKEWK